MKELKPALRFLGIFVGLYLALNFLYGWWYEAYAPHPDPATRWVTSQAAVGLRWAGENVMAVASSTRPIVALQKDERTVVSVYEGCNGLNVMIVFAAFIIAFRGAWRKAFWFVPLGILVIHLANLARVAALYGVAEYFPRYFYYVHKYLFTASIYAMVFFLWWLWIEKVNGLRVRQSMSAS